jgi:hypothetical protein
VVPRKDHPHQAAEPAEQMDEWDDADSLGQRTREERLPEEPFEGGLGEEERDGRQGRDACPWIG